MCLSPNDVISSCIQRVKLWQCLNRFASRMVNNTHPTQTVGPVARRHHDTANEELERQPGSELVVGFITSEM